MPFTAVLYCRFIVYEQFRRTTTRERCTMQTLPRDKPFFSRGVRSRRGGRGVKELFSSSKSRRGDRLARIIARKGEFIIDDAQNRRKIYRDKQAREAERIETGRETYALIFSYEQREWKSCYV